MSASINNLLVRLASQYYISQSTTEAVKIAISVAEIKRNLNSYFGDRITEIIEFGSYKRDTILPAEIDPKSDVDLMVVFDRSSTQYAPTTYLGYLRQFTPKYYSASDLGQSSPSFTIRLNHIGYDLVPAYRQRSFLDPTIGQLKIPTNVGLWQETDPVTFNWKVTKTNTNNNSLIKPLIRLLKAWNAKARYPYSGYELENKVIGIRWPMLGCRTLEDYFFYAIDDMTSWTNWFNPQY